MSRFVKLFVKEVEDLLPKHTLEFCVLMWLKRCAKVKSQNIEFKGRNIHVLAGQTVITYSDLGKKFKKDKSKIRRTLIFLEGEGLIRFESNNHYTIITIVNLIDYQSEIIQLTDNYNITEVEAKQIIDLRDTFGLSDVDAISTILVPRQQLYADLQIDTPIFFQSEPHNNSDKQTVMRFLESPDT